MAVARQAAATAAEVPGGNSIRSATSDNTAPEATAILSMSVMQAIAILDEARRRGLTVPHDLSVVGFNGIPEAAKCDPAITTVDGMGRERGKKGSANDP